jgi:hypothetical protein
VDVSDETAGESDMTEGVDRIVATRAQLLARIEGVGPLEPPLTELHSVIPHYTTRGLVAEVYLMAEAGADLERVRASALRLGRRLHQAHKDFSNVRLHLYLGEDRG